jgi:hypothetical protein
MIPTQQFESLVQYRMQRLGDAQLRTNVSFGVWLLRPHFVPPTIFPDEKGSETVRMVVARQYNLEPAQACSIHGGASISRPIVISRGL